MTAMLLSGQKVNVAIIVHIQIYVTFYLTDNKDKHKSAG